MISPAIQTAQAEGLPVVGPIPADSVFFCARCRAAIPESSRSIKPGGEGGVYQR